MLTCLLSPPKPMFTTDRTELAPSAVLAGTSPPLSVLISQKVTQEQNTIWGNNDQKKLKSFLLPLEKPSNMRETKWQQVYIDENIPVYLVCVF